MAHLQECLSDTLGRLGMGINRPASWSEKVIAIESALDLSDQGSGHLIPVVVWSTVVVFGSRFSDPCPGHPRPFRASPPDTQRFAQSLETSVDPPGVCFHVCFDHVPKHQYQSGQILTITSPDQKSEMNTKFGRFPFLP